MASTLDKARLFAVEKYYKHLAMTEMMHAYALTCEAETRREIADKLKNLRDGAGTDAALFVEAIDKYIEKLRGRK